MPLPLPNLDDRTFADLVEEARALIPGLDRGGTTDRSTWTNHNPSDPGITLIELFAWLAEQLIYRANRVTDRQLLTFLRLLNGPDWKPNTSLDEEIRATILALRQPARAVTNADYEQLARDAAPDTVARAHCIPRRNLEAGTEAERTRPSPGHMSVVIVPDTSRPFIPRSETGGAPTMLNLDEITLAEGAIFESRTPPRPAAPLRQTVWQALDPWRILTTRHHVVGPIYAPVSADLLIARRSDWPEPVSATMLAMSWTDIPDTDLRKALVERLDRFLDPVVGGPDGQGWPFGRSIYVSELYALLQRLPGVDHVPDVMLSSTCPAGETRCVAAAEQWHDDGDQIGLDLAPHHLPWARIDPARIVISTAFVPVHVTTEVTPSVGTDLGTMSRAVKQAIRERLHPLYRKMDGATEHSYSIHDVRSWITSCPEVDSSRGVPVSLDSDSAHITEEPVQSGNRVLHIRDDELVDVQITVTPQVRG